MAVQLVPITDADRPRAAKFLHDNLNDRVPVQHWLGSFDDGWDPDRPNNGFMLLERSRNGATSNDAIVGVYIAHYSRRCIGDREERVCNLGAWCVQPDRRFHSLRLLKALLAQPGFHFLDLSPSGNVIDVNRRLGFEFLDTATALVPALPWAWGGGTNEIVADADRIEKLLDGPELQLYRDHRGAPAAHHLVLVGGGRRCYVVFRMDRRKGLPRVFASILHVGDPELFHTMLRPLSGYLLARRGALAMLVELRLVGRMPTRSRMVPTPRQKMYLSPSLRPDEVDYFYSELVSMTW